MKDKKAFNTFLPKEVCGFIDTLGLKENEIQEIRMNTGQPLILKVQGKEIFPTLSGKISKEYREGFIISETMLKETFEFVCRHSV